MKIRFIVLTFMLSVFIFDDMNAQIRKRKTKKTKEIDNTEESLSLIDKLSGDIRIGNIGINQGFSLSIKPGIGYNVNKYLAGGLGSRIFVDYTNFSGQENTYVDYGGFAFARFKIQSFYIQGEYAVTKYEYSNLTVTYPLVGLGYLSSNGGKWSYGAELMYPLNAYARSYGPSLEYWLNFGYNF